MKHIVFIRQFIIVCAITLTAPAYCTSPSNIKFNRITKITTSVVPVISAATEMLFEKNGKNKYLARLLFHCGLTTNSIITLLTHPPKHFALHDLGLQQAKYLIPWLVADVYHINKLATLILKKKPLPPLEKESYIFQIVQSIMLLFEAHIHEKHLNAKVLMAGGISLIRLLNTFVDKKHLASPKTRCMFIVLMLLNIGALIWDCFNQKLILEHNENPTPAPRDENPDDEIGQNSEDENPAPAPVRGAPLPQGVDRNSINPDDFDDLPAGQLRCMGYNNNQNSNNYQFLFAASNSNLNENDDTITECPICLDNRALAGSTVVVPHCCHRYIMHLYCINRTLEDDHRCPACRREHFFENPSISQSAIVP